MRTQREPLWLRSAVYYRLRAVWKFEVWARISAALVCPVRGHRLEPVDRFQTVLQCTRCWDPRTKRPIEVAPDEPAPPPGMEFFETGGQRYLRPKA